MDNENIKNTAEETAEETDIKGGECDGMKNQKKEKKSDKKETEALKAEVEALKKELADAKDSHLRSLAEYDNFRKRSQREKDAVYGDAKANTLALLLPVIDNFDRAAENKTDDPEVYKKGIEMIISQFSDILKRLEVERFGEVGDEFDPNMHNAVMHVENDELPANTIAAVFEKGYKMGDRILRFATVQVAN
ncbi:MAG: nucleotide exchange factor GrpE [Oscillospiraceae bacterium]|nr:nucleotide exchange factor GrpE [Oscillospiraceae bacterium]MDD7470974.1 nucleotide exchange factor GrpE [Oscillospiraceae bacterium]MDY2678072.1 nucleotide exchange factor GrpE [Oscillospiraceae bacterium]